jgi:hypothetical protein
MKESSVLEQLETIADNLAIKICSVSMNKSAYNVKGGLCKVKGEYRVIFDKNLHLSEKIDVFVDALQGFDIENLSVDPYVKKIIERDGWKQKNMFSESQKN